MRNVRGIAALAVLWALLLLGTLAASFALSMRTEAQAARNGMDSARAYFQARTGINRAIAELSSHPPDNVLAMRISGEDVDASYDVAVESERGKVDVNVVSGDVLKGLLRNGGLSEEEANAVGDAILDWRDESGGRGGGGPADADYASLPEPIRPRHGKLSSVDELRSVKGVTPALFGSFLAKVFTVDTGIPQVNINYAPIELIRALPGFTAETAGAVVARRAESPFRSPAELVSFLGLQSIPPALFAVVTTSGFSGVFTITATGRAGGSVQRSIGCTVEVGGAGGQAARILRWADHLPAPGGEDA